MAGAEPSPRSRSEMRSGGFLSVPAAFRDRSVSHPGHIGGASLPFRALFERLDPGSPMTWASARNRHRRTGRSQGTVELERRRRNSACRRHRGGFGALSPRGGRTIEGAERPTALGARGLQADGGRGLACDRSRLRRSRSHHPGDISPRPTSLTLPTPSSAALHRPMSPRPTPSISGDRTRHRQAHQTGPLLTTDHDPRHTTNPPVSCLGRSFLADKVRKGRRVRRAPSTAPSGGRFWHGFAVRRPLLGGGGRALTFGLGPAKI